MRSKFSKDWKSSKQKRKQRLYRNRAPIHIKHKFLGAHLSKELRKKYDKRAVPVRKKDKVKIMRGQYKGHVGKIESVNVKKTQVFIRDAETTKKDGTKSFYPIHPSNLMIIELDLSDKKRLKSIKRK
ncbi:MAG: 50S ribosomal protein L24 [Candidatus Woesearchaeota archaeon]|nr:50S ribosomal protein L24 [Candidatus Woesearchaeota archaeon]